jgi:membrane-associated phospholipid phosphatase
VIDSPSRPTGNPVRVSTGRTVQSGNRSVARPDLVIAMSAACALVVIYLVAVQTRLGQVLDTRAMELTARGLSGAHWTQTLLTLISPATVPTAILVLGALVWTAKGATAAAAATVTAVGTVLVAAALKGLLARPTFLDTAANSLPSGHVAAVAGLAAAAALVTSPASRLVVAVTGLGAVALTGVATLALEWHRPSDVAAAALLATGVAATTHVWVTAPRRHSRT